MTTCTFSAGGERWSVWRLKPGMNEHVRGKVGIRPDATGLYFQAADGEERFLPMTEPELAALGLLSERSNRELADLAIRATKVYLAQVVQDGQR